MVYIANNVALRQLEIANAAILSRTSLRSTEQVSSEKKSIAKDGKFHPRVLTIVSPIFALPGWLQNDSLGW